MLRNYEEIVEFYRKNRVREMLSNGSRNHASTLFRNIFDAAIADKLDVRIVSGTLVREFYEPLTERLKSLLASNRVSVILTEPDSKELMDNSFLTTVSQSPNGRVRVASGLPHNNHFVVAGENIYRIELDHLRGMAAANFNDPGLGKRLVTMFGELDSESGPLEAFEEIEPDRSSTAMMG